MSPLDPHFQPFVTHLNQHGNGGDPLALTLIGEGGRATTFHATVSAENPGRVVRLLKFLLWSRGGWKVEVRGPGWAAELLAREYSPSGARSFDAAMMETVYGHPFEVVVGGGAPPEARAATKAIGGHLDGYRIGFDLGASDFKIAAVAEGEVIFSEEFPWDPKSQTNPEYHFDHLQSGLQLAAKKLPRLDAIGGSSAGVVVDNDLRVASLIRSVPPGEPTRRAQQLFKRIGEAWGVPVEVANDGDVTALAGAMSLGVKGILGIAMGSSEAAGFIDREGCITGWLNELAFAPVDEQPEAAVDEWSGDRGVGALYFSQQATNKLLPAAGISVPEEMGLPERLKEVQRLMADGDLRAAAIYGTVGTYLGHTIPLYARFYDFDHVLLLGRVTTGRGGEILIERARNILAEHYPVEASRIALHVPDEKSRRVGQAVAAASLPSLRP